MSRIIYSVSAGILFALVVSSVLELANSNSAFTWQLLTFDVILFAAYTYARLSRKARAALRNAN